MIKNYNLKTRLALMVACLVMAFSVNAQLTGVKNIPGDYATITLAVADLNAQGVGAAGVTFNVAAGYTETITSPISITATGTVADQIIFQKSGAGANPLITAYVGTSTPGSAVQDGIWNLVGSDYVSIFNIDLMDPNTTNPATMEYGFAFFKASATNGCQNNKIQGCTITLSRNNNAIGSGPSVEGSKAINVENALATTQTTTLTPITAASGANSFNKFYNNTISNCNYGVVIIGYADASPFANADFNNEIGGSISTGNTINNFGGATGAINASAGIRTLAQYNLLVTYNIVNNNTGSGVNHVFTLRGIYVNTATSANTTITNNAVTLSSGATTSNLEGINNASGSTAAGNTVNINNNVVQNCTYTTATSGLLTAIVNTGSAATVNLNNNTVSGNILPGTGTFTGIDGGSSSGNNMFMNNNTVVNNSKTGASGTFYCMRSSTALITVNGNTINNNVFTATSGASTANLYGYYNFGSPTFETYTNNSITNLNISGSATSASIIYGIYSNTVAGSVKTISNNQINSLQFNNSSTGTAVVYGINQSLGTTVNISKNKLYNLLSSGSGSTVSGIVIGSGTTVNVSNNIIGDLKAPTANAANPANGINITGGTTVNVYYNTIQMNITSTGINFGSSAIFASTTPTVTLRNNIFINGSTANGTGFTVAYRRSSTTLTSYGAASNNNIFYAGTPGASNLIFNDGTNSDQTIAAFQTRVAPRDAGSQTENVAFSSTAGASPLFLHVNTATPTLAESGGANIASYTDDFDGDIRQGNPGYVGTGTAPDIGADEFAGTSALPACSSVTAGSASAIPTTVCFNGTSSLTATGATSNSTSAGIIYQWVKSTSSVGPYTIIGGANATTYNTAALTVTTYYKFVVSCTNSGLSDSTAQVIVTVNPLPIVSVTPVSASICQPGGTAVALTASGANTYVWGPAAGLSATTGTSVNALPAATTTYTVTGTDGNGCTATATSVITISSSVTINSVTATPPSVCSGGNSILAVSASTAGSYCNPTYTTGTGASDYITNVTLGTINNTTGASAAPYSTYYSALSTNLTAGSPYTVTGTINNGGTEDIAIWIDYNQNNVFEATEKLGEQAGLSFSVPFTVPLGSFNGTTRMRVMNVYNTTGILPCNSYTYGEAEDYNVVISGGVNNFSYSWSPSTFLSGTTSSSVSATGITSTTTYTVVVTSAGGCSSTGTVTITAGSALTSTSTTTPASGIVCAGTNITLNSIPSGGGAPYTYAWTGPGGYTSTSQNPVITAAAVSASGTYTITVTDNCGASSTSTVSITVNPNPVVTVSPGSATFCSAGPAISLTAANAISYAWLPTTGLSGSTGASVNASPAVTTTYTVTGTDANSCAGTATTTITTIETPSISSVTATPATLCSGGNSQLNAVAGTTTAYSLTSPAFALAACASNAGPVGDDVVQGPNAVGFNFNYFGVTYTQFGLSTNGNIQLGNGSGAANNPAYSTAYTDVAIPSATAPNNMVALAWDDWLTAAGDITWGTSGVAPNRKLTVCFNTTGRGGGVADTLNGQIVLQEGTNNIYLNITKKGVSTNSATQGIENQLGTAASIGVPGRQNSTWSVTNDSKLFSPSGGIINYTWSPATFLSSTTIANPMANGMSTTTTYTVTADNGGCSAMQTVTVNVNPTPSAPAVTGTTTICSGNTASLNTTGVGTLGWYSAATGGTHIGSGNTFTTPILTANATYYVQDSSAFGCVSPRTAVTITVNPLPTVMAMSTASTVCSGASVTLSGMGATSYSWTGGVTDGVAFTPTTTNTYTVTGTDGNGCSNTATTTVTVNPLPTVTAMATATTVCSGTSVTLTGTGSATSYAWDNGITDGTPFTATATTTYMVTGTDANGCMNSDNITITVNPLPTVIAMATANTVCEGTSVTLTGSGATSYTWDNGVTDGVAFTPTATTTYIVTGTDGNGCSSTASTTVTVNTLPVVTASSDATGNTVCAGSMVILTGGGATSFAWDNGVTDGVAFTPTGTTTYIVTGTDANSCSNTASITITVNSVTVDLGTDITQCGGTVTLDAMNTGDTFVWNDLSTSQTLTVSATGTYSVTVTDPATGCSDTDMIDVIINPIPTVSMTPFTASICDIDPAFALTNGSPAGGVYSGTGVSGGMFDPAVSGAGMFVITYTITDGTTGCINADTSSVTVDLCSGITANTSGAQNITVYPNPASEKINISVGNANFSQLTISIVDITGKEVYNETDKNITAGYNKQINIEKFAKGVYYIKLNTGNDSKVQKLIVH